MNKLGIGLKTISQLGIKYSIQYGIYRLGLVSGHYRRITPSNFILPLQNLSPTQILWPFNIQSSPELKTILQEQKNSIISEGEEILNGRVHLFGGPAVRLTFSTPGDLQHWTTYELKKDENSTKDIKLIWEPARFGWAFSLGRAFILTNEDKYAQCFWKNFEEFTLTNPFNMGPNWSSGQEVALRLLALTFAGSIFNHAKPSSDDRIQMLLASIYMHARRIPPTLWYARAQNNNHLISEAVGLYTAGTLFKNLPEAKRWLELGWKWFNYAIREQIEEDGEYIQHSTNYHRLLLHTALWMKYFAEMNQQTFPDETSIRLSQSTKWSIAMIDPISGGVPNLGHNDGANILPLSSCPYSDYRPVAQAASRAFLGKATFPVGKWDELSAWFGMAPIIKADRILQPAILSSELILGINDSRAFLRSAHFNNRPAHADQLHWDLWFKGHNLLLDAGTYLYNAPSPWENSLAGTAVHNTITIDHQDQMNRISKFLWLDWAQAKVLKNDQQQKEINARHNGYEHLGINHERQVKMVSETEWLITDQLLSINNDHKQHHAQLHWLLPDWPWDLKGFSLRLSAPFGEVLLDISTDLKDNFEIDLIRAGKSLLLKKEKQLIMGWFSPTYNQIIPALSFCFSQDFIAPLSITSHWKIVVK